jgi:hypothetical protein
MVRVRKASAAGEVTLNGFEGENKEVIAAVPGAQIITAPVDPANVQHEWLQAGRAFSSADGDDTRHVNSGYGGPVLVARMPPHYDDADYEALSNPKLVEHEPISSGALAVMRIDGKGRGVAAGFGVAIARDRLEGELMVLRSDETGAYVGGRYRFLTGQFRPYGALGIPMFVFDAVDPNQSMATSHFGIGLRIAGGIEMVINGHISVQADLGYEHFWRVSTTNFESNLFVPTLGVIGRL